MYQKTDPVAVFDSGVGGISVLRHLRRALPNENFLYFGDSANAPYGTRTTEDVRRLVLAAADKLVKRNIKALVVACNTATAAAITQLRQAHPDLIIIGIEPALKLAADRFPGGHIGVMATPVTLREAKFSRLVERCAGSSEVSLLPAPGLMELVEAGKGESAEAVEFLRPLLEPYAGKLDALVLGCTHYPFAALSVRQILGEGTELLDGGDGTARETRRRLEEADLLNPGPGSVTLEDSSPDPAIVALARQLLDRPPLIHEHFDHE